MSHGQSAYGWPLNLELREWVLACLIFLKYPGRWGPSITRRFPVKPTPYTFSKMLNAPVWPIEKSLRSLVKDGLAIQEMILPQTPEEAEKLGRQIRVQRDRTNPKVPPRRYWHYYYYVTDRGEDCLQESLMNPIGPGEYEDYGGYWEMVFRWLWERTEIPALEQAGWDMIRRYEKLKGADQAQQPAWKKHARVRSSRF